MKTDKEHLDAIADALHPYWKGHRHTYDPQQLCDMIRALHNRIIELETENRRLQDTISDYQSVCY